jgi:hypothetical protein
MTTINKPDYDHKKIAMYKKHELMKHCSDLYKYSEELAKRLDAE